MKRQSSDTVLVSGFEVFGDEDVNPSEQLASNLHGALIEGHLVESVVLPVTFDGAFDVLVGAINRVQPKLIFCLGQAGGREAICVERLAANVCDAPIPDNAGRQPQDIPVEVCGPVGYSSSLPVGAIVAALSSDGLRAEVSNSAGTFVCNQVFYKLMSFLSNKPEVAGGFIHVPFLPEQASDSGCASMPLPEMERGLRLAIEVSLVFGASPIDEPEILTLTQGHRR